MSPSELTSQMFLIRLALPDPRIPSILPEPYRIFSDWVLSTTPLDGHNHHLFQLGT